MKKLTLIFALILVLIVAGATLLYFYTALFPRAGSDSAHLEGTRMPLPEHQSTIVTIHHEKSWELGDLWNGYSTDTIKGTWFGKTISAPRWAVSVDASSFNTLKRNDALSLTTFSVADNLFTYVNGLPGNNDAVHLLQENGKPDGKLTYVGLFSWKGSGAREYKDALLVGNEVYVQNIEQNPSGTYTVTYGGEFTDEDKKYEGASLFTFKYPPVLSGKDTHTLIIRIDGEKLVEVSRT